MKTLGIIAEYNPFHNGHIYHMKKAKEITNADNIVVLMSGNFVQRGEPAIVDKWRRAKAAVLNGADLVIELPFVYSSQTAEIFAQSAVNILDSLNTIDFLAFGSEAKKLDSIYEIADILIAEPDEYKIFLKNYLEKGYSFPKAREVALSNIILELDDEIRKSNNILAIEYIKALISIKSEIKPVNIERDNTHNSEAIKNTISSATAIRKELLNNELFNMEIISKNIPKEMLIEIKEFISEEKRFIDKKELHSIFLLDILRRDLKDDIFELNSSLLNRIKNNLLNYYSVEDFIKSLYTKNYTSTRINRVILNCIMNLKKNDMNKFKNYTPKYIRILGANAEGFKILNEIKKKSNIKVINSFSKIDDLNNIDRNIAKYDELATDLYFYLLSLHSKKLKVKMDYIKSPFINK